MSVTASHTTGDVRVRVTARHNCDDVELVWRVSVGEVDDAPLPGVRGFMLERQRRRKDGSWGAIEILRNRVGFAEDPATATGENGRAFSRRSNVWPFQCYDWVDHGANGGQTVRYRVSALRLPNGGRLGTTTLEPVADSGWTNAIEVEADTGRGVSAFFNRGAVMSQYVARIARANDWGPRNIKKHIKELKEPLRRFLAGELRVALLRLLDGVIDDPSLEFYAALYELSDDELIGRLELLSGRAHVVLANGSDKTGDGNAAARARLQAAEVDVRDRMLGSKGLGHTSRWSLGARTALR